MKTLAFIVNPVSGGKDKKNILAAIARHLDLSRCKAILLQTGAAGEATRLAREVEADIVVAVGGDGTVSEVARGLIGTQKALGIIPCGSGDGLALHLGISREPALAVKVLNEACMVPMDYALLDGKPFFCTAGVGLDARVSWDFAASTRRGLPTYIHTAWEDWKKRRPEHFRITTDDAFWDGEAVFVTVCNANQWGNEARIAPKASVRDGLLDVTIVTPFDTLEIPDLATRLMTGKALSSRHVVQLHGARVQIEREAEGPAHLDGDPFTAGKALNMELQPAGLRVVVPQKRKDRI